MQKVLVDQPPAPKMPAPLFQGRLHFVVVSRFEYLGGGPFEVPALPGDHLSVTLSGANVMERRLDGRTERGAIGPGDVTLVPRGASSSWHPRSGPSAALHLLIPPDLWRSVGEAADLPPGATELRPDFATPDAFIEQVGRALLTEAHSEWFGGRLYAQTLEQSLAMHLLRHYSALGGPPADDAPRPAGRFRRSLEYIEAHLADDLSLETLAACEGLSPYHFARAFKRAVGQPPHGYVVVRRVRRAQELLARTRLPLAQVAAEVGFANQAHLNRHFKRLVGLTPRQYRA